MPAPLAALVRDNDRVTVTGTVKRFVRADVEREWGWLDLTPEVEVEFSRRPVIVADRIIGGDSHRVMMIAVESAGPRPTGTSGSRTNTDTDASAPVTVAGSLASADDELVGRKVDLNGVKVTGVADQGGFFVAAQDRQLFVLSGDKDRRTVAAGQTVSIDGLVMQMPERMRDRLKAPGAMNRQIYVYATNVN
jgi:hypothetical protein